MIETAEKPVYRCGSLTYTTRGLFALFAWMLWGDFCWTLMQAVVPSVMPLKLRSLDSPNVLIGFIMTTLPGWFNIVVTPYISFKSDRHRSPYGRRLPFITYTIPFLTISLLLIGYSDSIGHWVNHAFLSGNPATEAKVIITLLAVFAAMFDFFNMFVYTVYWYLFNDVVPEAFMGRFMSWFQLVGPIAGVIFNFFVFKYAESHMRPIYLGAALIYLVGFGIVCLRIKEGEYPPVDPTAKKPSLMDNFRTFWRECYTMRHYWDIFLNYAFIAMSGCIGVFNIFFMKSLGLDLDKIGKMGAIGSVTIPICLAFAGILVDRWNAVRVAAYLAAYGAFFAFGNWVWLFIDTPPTMVYFWIGAISGAVFGALFSAMNQMIELPRLIALMPKDRFGQFCGAITLCRAPAVMLGGVLAGAFVDVFKHFYPTGNYAYRFNFLWSAPIAVLAFYFNYRTFRSWKRLGGEKSYVAPVKPFKYSELKPHPDDTGKVQRGLLLVVGIAFTGGLLSSLAWWIYYTFFAHQPHDAGIWLAAMCLNIFLFLVYIRFIKFMERP